ncbi:MAG: DUF4476 domain-containing protein [Flavobacteriaceae bacterium]
MKARLLFSALFLFLAQLGFSQNKIASLQVEFQQTRANYVFQLGNETFNVKSNVLIIDELSSGFHPVEIFEFRRNRKIVVYKGGINLARKATTLAFFNNGEFEVFGIEHYFYDDEVIIEEVPVISNEMFQQLKRSVENESFDSSRLELLESTLKNNFFTSNHIKELMTLLSFDSGRLQFAKSAYTSVVDPENYFVVRDAFKFSSSKSALTKHIESLPAN